MPEKLMEDMRRVGRNQVRASVGLVIAATMIALAAAAAIIVGVVVVHKVDDLRAFSQASRTSRVEFQARQTFLLCSRDLTKTVIPARRAEVHRTCVGYETMARALATETRKQNAAG